MKKKSLYPKEPNMYQDFLSLKVDLRKRNNEGAENFLF